MAGCRRAGAATVRFTVTGLLGEDGLQLSYALAYSYDEDALSASNQAKAFQWWWPELGRRRGHGEALQER